jgi:hypothetical protein
MSPLKGLKVVELARILAGPWIGQTLADLGADVTKVEVLKATTRAHGARRFLKRTGLKRLPISMAAIVEKQDCEPTLRNLKELRLSKRL